MGEMCFTSFSSNDFVKRLEQGFQYQTNEDRPIYYLFPSNKWLQVARKNQPGIAFQTFDDLAILLLNQTEVKFTKITEEERSLFFYEILNREQHFLSEMELSKKAKAYSDSYGQLKRLGLNVTDTPLQLQALTDTFYTYEQEYRDEKGMYDPENRIMKAIEAAENLSRFPLSGVVIDGFMDFSPVQYLFIEFLQKKNVPFTIYLPNLDNEMIKVTETTLQRLGVEVIGEKAPTSNLLCKNTMTYKATTIEEEIFGVLMNIARLKGQGQYREFGIVLASEANYLQALQRISKVVQIPILKPRKIPIKETSFASFIKLLFDKENITTKWDQLALVEAITVLCIQGPDEFIKVKEMFISTGEILDPEISAIFKMTLNFQSKLPEASTMRDFSQQFYQFIQQLPLMSIWKKFIKEKNSPYIQQLALEMRAFQRIMELLNQSLDSMSDTISNLNVHIDCFRDVFIAELNRAFLYLERTPADGIDIYSFRDVPLFRGKHLFVMGLNEGVFPKQTSLSGYFQERYLENYTSPFPLPLSDIFRKKVDAAFDQLKYIAETLAFSYVGGMNPHQPLLASKYIMDEPITESFSTASRYNSITYQSNEEFTEKLAYHYGIGKKIATVPGLIRQYIINLKYLESGQELLSDKWAEKLSKNKLSITGLERYAACSFRYGLERIFKVREPLNKQSRMDPIETGNMIHRIIETFYRDVKGVPFGRLTEFFQANAEAKLELIFEAEWENLKRLHPEISQIKLDKAKRDWWKKFRRWLAAEQERFWHNGELAEMRIFRIEEPVELTFMLEKNVELTLSGKIDRVDIDEHGFVIYDYKTSDKNLDFNHHIPAGVVLQIPLYLMALAREFKQGKYQTHKINHGEAIGGGYISMKDPHRRKQNMVWKDQDHRVRFEPNKKYKTNIVNLDSESLRQELKLDELITRLWRGTFTDFSVKPFNADECKYCIYKPICRVTTEQQNT